MTTRINVRDVIDTKNLTDDEVSKIQQAVDNYQPAGTPTVSARDVFVHREKHLGRPPEEFVATSVQDAAAEEAQMSARDMMNFRDAHQGMSPTEWASRGSR